VVCAAHPAPSVSTGVVRLKVINGDSPGPASNNKQDVVRNSRAGNAWCREYCVSRRDCLQVLQERHRLSYDGSTCLVSHHVWMILYLLNSST
jgi:hypothetical protein